MSWDKAVEKAEKLLSDSLMKQEPLDNDRYVLCQEIVAMNKFFKWSTQERSKFRMMPYEHYTRAEDLLADAQLMSDSMEVNGGTAVARAQFMQAEITQVLLTAQVHATLANVGTKISAGDGSI